MKELNLLDPERVRALQLQERGRRAVRISTIIFVTLLLTAGFQWSTLMNLDERNEEVDHELNRTRLVSPTGKDLPVTETTKRLNRRLAVLKPILDDPWVGLIAQKFISALPTGVTLTDLQIDTKAGSLIAKGTAATRNDIPSLQANLDGLEIISKPIIKSNINDRANVQFDVTTSLRVPTGATP